MGNLLEQSQQRLTNWESVREISQAASRRKFQTGSETHVWQVDLKDNLHSNHLLTQEEREKSARFRFSHDQNRYTISHSMLRLILSTYMNCNPSTLIFDQTKYGKPFLKGEKAFNFNMTYSGDVVCYMLSMKNDVGIDIEYMKPDFDWFRIARLYFSRKEVSYLEGLPSDKQAKGFFKLWTQKEALLKAEGIGLSGIEKINNKELDDIEGKYLLTSFDYGINYQGALAIGPEESSVRFFTLSVD